MASLFLSLLLFLLLISPPSFASSSLPPSPSPSPFPSPFTAKAAALRYWRRRVPHGRPLPSFLLSKLSPLSPDTLSSLSSFLSSPTTPLPSSLCSAAGILCSLSSLSPLLSTSPPSEFSSYHLTNFSSYGDSLSGGRDAFRGYSADVNVAADSFRRYSRRSAARNDSFQNYAADANIAATSFSTYSTAASAAAGEFSSYAASANAPGLRFSNYDDAANRRPRTFSSYSEEANSGDESFASYGRHATATPEAFSTYAADTNVVGTGFSAYADAATAANDSFATYGAGGNQPVDTFRNYAAGGSGDADTFVGYRASANTGKDTFLSYAKRGTEAREDFMRYGASVNPGSDWFRSYGEGAADPTIGFRVYAGLKTNFKSYTKAGSVTFATYRNSTSIPPISTSGKHVNRPRRVEPGKFFRESSLRKGAMLPMPDVRDKLPAGRSFLPGSVAKRSRLSLDLLGPTFGVPAGSALGREMAATVADCERAPSRGETKRCVASAEDMIDFAVSMLGDDIVVRSIESVNGSSREVLVGEVRAIDGGRVTRSVSCHQSLFPYLVYYCHSVPKARVYEADILDAASKQRINHGVAICHLDTSDWSPGHGAFVALGSRPGEIEVCHWIFEGDMTWTVAD